jgi:hypothetical protein
MLDMRRLGLLADLRRVARGFGTTRKRRLDESSF